MNVMNMGNSLAMIQALLSITIHTVERLYEGSKCGKDFSQH